MKIEEFCKKTSLSSHIFTKYGDKKRCRGLFFEHHTPKSCFRTSFFRNAGAKVVFFFESPKVFAKNLKKIILNSTKRRKISLSH